MNNLSQREKNLVALMGSVVPFVAIFFGWMSYNQMLTNRQDELTRLEKQKSDLELLQFEADMEMDRYTIYTAASLSQRVKAYNNRYEQYFLDLIEKSGLVMEKKGGISPSQVKVDETSLDSEELYYQIKLQDYKLSGTTEQLTRFLFDFYDAALMQRIDTLVISEVAADEEDTELNISIGATALVLPDAEEDKPFESYAHGRVGKSYDELAALVVGRNVFGPPNEAPSLSSRLLNHDLEVGERFSVSNFAADDAEDESLTYELLASELEGVTLEPREDGRSARLSGPRVDKEGTYKVKVRVSDNRIPKLFTEETLTLDVSKPEIEDDREDEPDPVAGETYITSLLHNLKGDQIVRLRNDDDRFELKLGETFELDGDTWKVTAFDLARRQVTLLRGDKTLKYKLGSTLDKPMESEENVKVSTRY